MGLGLRAEGWRSSGRWGYGAWRLGLWELRHVAGEGTSEWSSYLRKVPETVGPDPNPVRAVNMCVTWGSVSAWPFLVDKHKGTCARHAFSQNNLLFSQGFGELRVGEAHKFSYGCRKTGRALVGSSVTTPRIRWPQ